MQGALAERELLKRDIPLQTTPAHAGLRAGETFEKSALFSAHFIDSKALYLHLYGMLPSITVLRDVDYAKAWTILQEEFGNRIIREHHYATVSRRRRKEEKEESILQLQESIVIEMGDGYVELYHNNPQSPLLRTLSARLLTARGKRRKEPQELHLITRGDYGLELTKLHVKRTKLDLALHYEDDFAEVHKTILKRLNERQGKGIVLLHGLPGTGKTTYLRYLVGKMRKRVLMVPPDAASGIVNPDLVKLLIENPNSVVIIEDAESILMQRQPGTDSAVSNLLNISDGLLADMLNVQLICTFNSPLTSIDPALMRKGRLVARYEFGKLSLAKAQKLSRSLGHTEPLMQPVTLAEVLHRGQRDYEQERPRIGFGAVR